MNNVSLSPAPLFHAGALCGLTIQTFHVGGTLVLQREFDPTEAWELTETNDVTKSFLIPTMLNAMLQVPEWQFRYDLSSLELVVAGGEPIPAEMKEALSAIDVPLVPGYGLSETTDGTLMLRPRYVHEKDSKCMGSTFTYADVKIVDENGEAVAPGERGEIIHRGPQVVDAYWRNPEATAQT